MAQVTLGVVKLSVSGTELGGIDKALLVYKHTTGDYPQEEQFRQFLSENLLSRGGKDQGLDQWGSSYSYKRYSNGYRITTAGPDKRFGTEDDLYLERRGNKTYVNKDISSALDATLDGVARRNEKVIETAEITRDTVETIICDECGKVFIITVPDTPGFEYACSGCKHKIKVR